MGNQICDKTEHQPEHTVNTARTEPSPDIVVKPPPNIRPPKVDPIVTHTIQTHQEYLLKIGIKERDDSASRISYGGQVYEGQTNSMEEPHGVGRIYKLDGSVFLGSFKSGKAHGKGLYVLADGSFYKGDIEDNKAKCLNGVFENQEFRYQGGFEDNLFNGQGKEESERHCFEGRYQQGVKALGQLKWKGQDQTRQYCYYGKFDEEGLFTDDGSLKQPQGCYMGQFLKGQKHGTGVYKFNNDLKYEGSYLYGVRQGHGKVKQASKDLIIYEGGWKNGLPDGQGFKYEKDGSKVQTFFKDGINILTLLTNATANLK